MSNRPPFRFTRVTSYVTTVVVIRSFCHRGVENFFRTGSKAGIQPKHEWRLRILLTALNLSSVPEDMNRQGWDFHRLRGTMKNHYAVKVNGNWRLTFAFDGQDAILVDYTDYH
ncbi:MAG: type II toxin-antitoxin system RelE/ParE family toxin [Acidobacteriaceae bacterium]